VARSFRFKPRFRGIAFTSVGIGGALGVVSFVALGAALLPLATSAIGIALGAGYLLSPSWKLEVVIDDDALEVRSPKSSRFKLAWADVVKVVASPTTHTCFVDGGTPAKSLIVPGDGAPAPYDLEDRAALYDAILARVAADKVLAVDTLEAYLKAQKTEKSKTS
jgi:hypothetical protein